MNQSGKLILALPKGRVLKKFCTLLKNTKFNLVENPENTRKILLKTKSPDLQVLIIRGWDVPVFVSSGVAHVGVVGKDILLESNSEEFIELMDLQIGKCRISLAGQNKELLKEPRLRVATKYTKLAEEYLSSKEIQPDIIYLRGSQEIAPSLNLSDAIIDLVETGRTLTENSLVEIDIIRNISSRLIANKAALKTKGDLIEELKTELLNSL